MGAGSFIMLGVYYVIRLYIEKLCVLYVICPEEHQLAEPEMIAQQILTAALGADENLQRVDRMHHFSCIASSAGIGQPDPPTLPDGRQKLKNQLTVQGVQDVVVLELEIIRYSLQLVLQEGTNNT